MSIYVGDKKALLLKSDNSVVEFYKGDKKLFGYDGKAVGAPLSIGDVHPAEHNVGVKLTSKNLYAPTLQNFNGNGITAVKNNDNTYTINGTASEEIYIHVGEVLPCEEGKTYYFSGGTANIFVAYQLRNNGSSVKSITVNDRVQSDNATNWNEVNVVIEIPKGTVADNVIIKPMISLFDNTPYTPFVADLTGIEVRKCGANLFPFGESVKIQGRYINGVSDSWLPKQTDVEFLRGKRIRYSAYFDLSGAVEDTTTASVKIIQYDDNGTIISQIFSDTTLKKSDGTTQGRVSVGAYILTNTSAIAFCLCVYFNSTSTPDPNSFVTVSQGMVKFNTGAIEHEPYTETIYTANADGTVEGVKSISPNMTLIPNNNAVTVECEYCKA